MRSTPEAHIGKSAAGFRGRVVLALALVMALVASSITQSRPALSADEPIRVPVTINKQAAFDLSAELLDGEQFIGIDEATLGVATIDASGSGSYMPKANVTGDETLRAWAKGTDAATRAIAVTFATTGEATGAEARGDFVETSEDSAVTIYPLGNDAAGPGGGPLTLVLDSEPAHGQADLQADGSIVYTPDPNWHGNEEFWYSASDGKSSKSAPIGVHVLSVRDLPTATPDALVIRQGERASIDVLVNDHDGDGDPFWVAGSTPPGFGTISWSDSDRMFWYQPNPDFHGVDQFSYVLADADGQSTGTVTVTVDGAPAATGDAIQVEFGGSITFDPRANDTDPEGSPLTIESVTKPAHGKASIRPDGTVSYRADASEAPEDTFSYTVQDNIGNTATASVVVARTAAVAAATLAEEDEFLVLEDSAGNTLDLLGNDTIPEGMAVVLTITSSPSYGTLVVDAMQQVTYAPNPEFSGTDSFAYQIASQSGTSNAVVSVAVQPQNDLPVAVADSAVTDEDTPVTIPVLENDTDIDGDDLVVDSIVDGTLGRATIAGDGVVYTPNPDASGTDQFSYVVSDGFGGTAMMSVTIAINPIADPPLVADDTTATDPGKAIAIDVLGNDRDPDGDPLVNLTIVDQPGHGTATIQVNGSISYQPEKQFEGKDTFTYSIADPSGNVSSGQATIQVGEPNAKPEAEPDQVTIVSGKAIRIDVMENDADPDGDELALYRVGKAEHGEVEIRGDKIRYEPAPGFVGTDTFTYRVTDGDETDTGRVTVVVTAPEE